MTVTYPKEEIYERLLSGETAAPAGLSVDSPTAAAVVADMLYAVERGGGWGPFDAVGGVLKFDPGFVTPILSGKKTVTRRLSPRGVGPKTAVRSDDASPFAELVIKACVPEAFVANFVGATSGDNGGRWASELAAEGLPALTKVARKDPVRGVAEFYGLMYGYDPHEFRRVGGWTSAEEVADAVTSAASESDVVTVGLRVPTLYRHGFAVVSKIGGGGRRGR